MLSVDYSRTSCLFSVLATVETCCICSVLTRVDTSCLCSNLTTVEPFVYFQFNYSTCRSHMFMCSVNYSIHFYLFLALTTVEPCVCGQFNYSITSCLCSILSTAETLVSVQYYRRTSFLIYLAKCNMSYLHRLASVSFSHFNILL